MFSSAKKEKNPQIRGQTSLQSTFDHLIRSPGSHYTHTHTMAVSLLKFNVFALCPPIQVPGSTV